MSDWLANPNDYVFPTYLTTLTALIARSNAVDVDWIGTSMGGLLGIVIAAQAHSPIRRLVVNDVGPQLEAAALARIGTYIGQDPTFATYAEIEAYLRQISAPFGPLDDAQWQYITRTNVRQRARRPLGLGLRSRHCRTVPQCAGTVRPVAAVGCVRCAVLVLRGAQSDLLSARSGRGNGGARSQAACH